MLGETQLKFYCSQNPVWSKKPDDDKLPRSWQTISLRRR